MKKTAVFFPGIGYHCDKPLLYYASRLAGSRGYDCSVKLSYTCKKDNLIGNPDKMQEAFDALYAQAEEQLLDVTFDDEEEILFISKSIGTAIATAYAARHGLTNVRHILYTPLEMTFLNVPEKAIAFIGTKDPWSDVDKVVKLAKAQSIPISVYENANHSLETEDVLKNIEILQEVMNKTGKYIEED